MAGNVRQGKKRIDESVKLVLDREAKKARKTQGPLLPGLERCARMGGRCLLSVAWEGRALLREGRGVACC
jgi:hypothetical protein